MLMPSRLDIVRPGVCLLSVMGLVVGMILLDISVNAWYLPMLSVALLCASGNTINDFFDRKIDAINRPNRPIPSGRMTPGEGFLIYLFLTFTGLLLSFFVSWNFFIFAAFNSIVIYLYSMKFKRTVLGNLVDTYLAVSVFIAPVLIGGGIFDFPKSPLIFIASISFFVNYGREILKSVEDVRGDKSAGARTLPIVIGEKNAVLFGKIMVLVGSLFLFLPYYFGLFGEAYFIFSLALFLGVVFILGLKNASKVQRLIKIVMFLALLAFLAFSASL
ncbi:MAG: geranylgeranylglycerol-phosphate geranylgeranyltransferase [Candidatus Aenigmarchaeota archaeon]|nr:geranylgeranylglycerol-phosphate geranylgeranyltransferase [Candidatus Aenigmarchaeota archaeon]